MTREPINATPRKARAGPSRDAVWAARKVIRADNAERRKKAKLLRPPRVEKAGQEPRQRDTAYLHWIRRLPCVCSLTETRGPCSGPVQAAHLRYSDARFGRCNPGAQRKPHDRLCTPLCAGHHALQHHVGDERRFWAQTGIEPGDLTAALSKAYDENRDGSLVVQLFASDARINNVKDQRSETIAQSAEGSTS